MKKTSIIFYTLVFFLILGFAGHLETHYTRKDCTVAAIRNGYVVFEDKHGSQWSYNKEKLENFQIGEIVNLKMDTNGTDTNIHDDIIVKVVKK